MTRTGRIEAVWLERRGTQMTAAAPSGTQVLSVAFTGDFDEDGGQLYHVPTGVVYDYSSFDANAETITLAAALPVGESFDDGDAIRVYPLAEDAYAHVRLEDVASDEEPITARIAQGVRPLLPEGQREDLGESVRVENLGTEWVVTDVTGNTQAITGTGYRLEEPTGNYFEFRFTSDGNPVLDIKGTNAIIEWFDDTDFLVGWRQHKITPAGVRYLQDYINGSRVRMQQALDGWYVIHDATGGIALDDSGFLRKFVWAGTQYIDDFAIEGWNDLTLINGWSHQAGHLVPGYKLHATGTVELCGGLTGGTTANGTPIATLPSGYIPSADVRIPIMSNANPTGGETRLVIRGITTAGGNPSGTVEIFGVGAGASLSLDGCTFPVDR